MPVELRNRRRAPRVTSPWIRDLSCRILDAVDQADAELSVVLTDDTEIHGLNKTWRDKDRPTDVLSFPQTDEPFPGAPVTLGDVVISMDTAHQQSLEMKHSLEDEVTRLMVHGVLHLLGHDHEDGGPQAERMKREEMRVLTALGVGRIGPLTN